MKQVFGILGLVLVLLSVSSCSKEYRKYRKWYLKGTIDQRDSAAFYFFERKEYDKAGYIFEELLTLYKGRPRAQEVLYNLAYTKFYQRSYQLSAYHFEQFVSLYPNNKRTQECAFQQAYCYYLLSDPHYLDQGPTRKAIEQFQIFLVSYDDSEKAEQATTYITELRERIAKKEYEQATLYHNIGRQKAAVSAYQTFLSEFPDSGYREEAQFMLFKSAVMLADISIDNKKKNRYLDALDFYTVFVDRYPSSKWLKEAEGIYGKARKNLGKLQAKEVEGAP